MTTPQSPPAGEELQALTDKRFSIFNDELIERYFNAEGKAALSAYILAQVKELRENIVDPQPEVSNPAFERGFEKAKEMFESAAQARFGAGEVAPKVHVHDNFCLNYGKCSE